MAKSSSSSNTNSVHWLRRGRCGRELHFVEVITPQRVRMRTWERGSGITQACGTGASAVAVAGALTGRTERRIVAEVPGGELELDWTEAGSVLLTGPAEEVFEGIWQDD